MSNVHRLMEELKLTQTGMGQEQHENLFGPGPCMEPKCSLTIWPGLQSGMTAGTQERSRQNVTCGLDQV